jgi:hypothetical protein
MKKRTNQNNNTKPYDYDLVRFIHQYQGKETLQFIGNEKLITVANRLRISFPYVKVVPESSMLRVYHLNGIGPTVLIVI